MERGCVEDQPQPVKHAEALVNSEGLRLVEDDTVVSHFLSEVQLILFICFGAPSYPLHRR
jgi:hypothetical protein